MHWKLNSVALSYCKNSFTAKWQHREKPVLVSAAWIVHKALGWRGEAARLNLARFQYNVFSVLLKESVDLGEIMFSLCYLPTAGRLTLTVIKCRNLKAMDITGYSGGCWRLRAPCCSFLLLPWDISVGICLLMLSVITGKLSMCFNI